MAITGKDLSLGKIMPFPYTMKPLNNITPFTYDDGTTFLEVLMYFQEYLQGLSPDIDAKMQIMIDEYQEGIKNAEDTITAERATWQELFDDFMRDVQASMAVMNDAGMALNINNTASQTRVALDTIYATNSELQSLDIRVDNNKTFIEGLGQRVGIVETSVTATNVKVEKNVGDISSLTTVVNGKIPNTAKGANNGVATLGATGKVTTSQLPSFTISGAFSQRPAANTVPNGTVFYSIDTMDNYRSDGISWGTVGYGGMYGYAQITSGFDTPNTTGVDVPGLAVTFTAGSRPVKITLSGDFKCSTTKSKVIAWVELNGSRVIMTNFESQTAEVWGSASKSVVRTLTPGTVYTAKVKILTTSGYGHINGSSDNPSSLTVEGM